MWRHYLHQIGAKCSPAWDISLAWGNCFPLLGHYLHGIGTFKNAERFGLTKNKFTVLFCSHSPVLVILKLYLTYLYYLRGSKNPEKPQKKKLFAPERGRLCPCAV